MTLWDDNLRLMTLWDDTFHVMTNKFDDRFAERHHAVSSGTVIHEVVITTCCVIYEVVKSPKGRHPKCPQ